MDWVARLVYGALVWEEKRRARAARRGGQADGSDAKQHHLKVGARGEKLAYWHLRRAGYAIVARNRRPHSGSGELDLVGWDGPVLAFIEVKTRSGTEAGLPESAVSFEQQRRIVKSAQEYMRRLKRKPAAYRFDIASVLWDPAEGYQVCVLKDAFKE
ncbi:MAG: YraN family protein [Acidobacteriota bacterium]